MPIHDTNQLWIYAITIWDTIDAQPHIFKYFSTIAKHFIYQLEMCPTTKTPHFQCYVNLKTKKRQREMVKMLNAEGFMGADVKPSSDAGKIALKGYCMKDDTKLDGPWADKPVYLGRDIQIVTKNKQLWQQKIEDSIDVTPDDRMIEWFYDEHGCRGKTKFAKYLCYTYPKKVTFLSVGKASDLLNFVYKMQGMKMYILDITRTIPKYVMQEIYHAIESVKNGFFLNTKYDTGMAMFETPHVIVFSNKLPDLQALSSDRWSIKDMSQMSQEN